jgi:hypothetical protein
MPLKKYIFNPRKESPHIDFFVRIRLGKKKDPPFRRFWGSKWVRLFTDATTVRAINSKNIGYQPFRYVKTHLNGLANAETDDTP